MTPGSAASSDEGQSLAAVQDRLAAAVKDYVSLASGAPDTPPFRDEHELTLTEVATAAAALLKQANIEIFELAIWSSWGC